ncbi:MAG: serine/threonine-protein kinase [bacterium]
MRVPPSLAERYPVARELGRGGMAAVYLARDLKHGSDVAVKVVRPAWAAATGRERFLREIAIAAQLHHPHIVPLYDSGEAEGVLFYVMPYEDGPSLRARLSDEGVLPIIDAMAILRDVTRALAYAHGHGVVHRDPRPDNVLLSEGSAMVTDFEIAKALTAATGAEGARAGLTQTGLGIGTLAYMAPEQVLGDPDTDHRADIYSFGCLAYELFTGKPPFTGCRRTRWRRRS